MADKRILIVEDERIVAEDIKRLLQKMSYAVTGIASDGQEAIEKVKGSKPDLVLMDIRIQGPQDGIEVAEYLYTHFDVPVCYLTAYADEPTLERAKATMPFGYLLKPFDPRSLQTAVELAIYRHKMESTLAGLDGWHARALQSLGDAVIGTDAKGHITFMNRSAEKLSGWPLDVLYGRPFQSLFWEYGKKGASEGTSIQDLMGQDAPGILMDKNGSAIPVVYTCTPLDDEGGVGVGALFVLRKTIPSPAPAEAQEGHR